LSGIVFLSIGITFVEAGYYCPEEALDYANRYWNKVVSDGYFYNDTGVAIKLGKGSPVPTSYKGTDCAHFVSHCIGREPHDTGGLLDVGFYSGDKYGKIGAQMLHNWLIFTSRNGTPVNSVYDLKVGDVICYDEHFDGTDNHCSFYRGNGKVSAHSNSYLDANWYYIGGIRSFIHINPSHSGDVYPRGVACGDGVVCLFRSKFPLVPLQSFHLFHGKVSTSAGA
jgi:hypothetical protein